MHSLCVERRNKGNGHKNVLKTYLGDFDETTGPSAHVATYMPADTRPAGLNDRPVGAAPDRVPEGRAPVAKSAGPVFLVKNKNAFVE
jgi:hypothetical protein